jgi:hypothetical protein
VVYREARIRRGNPEVVFTSRTARHANSCEAPLSTSPAGPASTSSRPIDRGLAIIIVIAVALLGSLLWVVNLRSDLSATQSDLDAANAEIAMLREQANATAYQLQPTSDAPAGANGTAFFSLDGTGVIFVANLDPLPEGRT